MSAPPVCLRACYAMPGTDAAYGGTNTPYLPTRVLCDARLRRYFPRRRMLQCSGTRRRSMRCRLECQNAYPSCRF
eukprot:571699-Rhodomonas_salina.1